MIPIIDAKGTGNKIKAKMISAGKGTKDLQRECGLSVVQSVYKWFNGDNVPTIDNLVILAKLFNCKIDDLLEVRHLRYD